MRKRLQRSLDNLRSVFTIVKKRMSHRRPAWKGQRGIFVQPSPMLLGILALLLAGCFLVDAHAAAYFRSHAIVLKGVSDVVTNIGLSGWYLVPAAVVLVIVNQVDWAGLSRRGLHLAYCWTSLAFLILSAVGLSGLVVNLLKFMIGRARPRMWETLGEYSFHPFTYGSAFASFPSGHSTTVGAVAAILSAFFPGFRGVFLVAALILGSSRVVVGAHYLSDVVAGVALGWFVATLSVMLFARLGYIFIVDRHGNIRRKRSFRLFAKA